MTYGNRNKSPRPPDVAFKNPKAANISRAIQTFADEQFKLHKHDFTPDELLRLFVDPERRELLKDSYKIAAPRGFVSELYLTLPPRDGALKGVSMVDLKFSWDNRRHPNAWLVPNDAGSGVSVPVRGVQPDCPEELNQKFILVFNDLVDISYRFGMCAWVFNTLNHPSVCSTAAQLRYYWPCILPLLRKAGHREDANELAEPSVRAGSAVSVPTEIGPYLKETNETLARAQLIEPEQVRAIDLKMSYGLREVKFFDGKFDGLI